MNDRNAPPLPAWVDAWFPLVPRARPRCEALGDRLDALRATAEEPGGDPLATAAMVFNRAALVASDCGLDELSYRLCWRQFDAFAALGPLPGDHGMYLLQPVVNLGRLLVRAGRGDDAYAVFRDTFDAVTAGGPATIDGRRLDFGELLDVTDAERQELRTFLWGKVLLNDGTRALTRAGRWGEALRHVERYRGIGTRMLEGRQVAVLARCAAADTDGALSLLDGAEPSEPWELALTACLRTLCRHLAGRPAGSRAAEMLAAYHRLPASEPLVVTTTRLGLAVVDLAARTLPTGAAGAAAKVTREAVSSGDAHAAADILAHPGGRAHLADADVRALTAIVATSGLRRGTMPPDQLASLLRAVRTGEALLAAPRAGLPL